MSRLGDLGARLYRGEAGYDFIGKRFIWYGVSILITILAFAGLGLKGLHMGVEFSGGAVFTTPEGSSISVEEARETAQEAAGNLPLVQELGNGSLRIQVSDLDTEESTVVREQLAERMDLDPQQINAELVGPSWGSQIANKAWQGLAIFMVLVVIYLAIAFEWRKAVAALIALIHDITITVGVYAIVGFEVTPGTVIGLLTILGYSLYDTVVVYDGLKETTHNYRKQTRFTYAELANRSLNATLVRSINTSVVALLPVAGLLFIGGGVLGGGMLNDIALSIFVGLAAGAYSSIMIATPLVSDLKSRESAIKAHDRRILAKRAKAEKAEDGTAEDAGADEAETDEDDAQDEGDEGAAASGEDVPEPRARATAGSGAGRSTRSGSRSRGRGKSSGKRR
ncbi:protein translocase subunit SecF [Streptomyces sp. XM4193]|uniref:protein translocase subunit SecF n=1 Tax=Streptomyces sp. XM4193 TaxID=2929782 RepID=UPI001FF73D51|nr:protein translocase subunit SecF [Streptomyces sp. XM4193]MCK1797845.1 protein translocase subunit SecF [Streptomyces sp. XM4193]